MLRKSEILHIENEPMRMQLFHTLTVRGAERPVDVCLAPTEAKRRPAGTCIACLQAMLSTAASSSDSDEHLQALPAYVRRMLSP